MPRRKLVKNPPKPVPGRPKSDSGLNDNQLIFVQYYLVSRNATFSAKKAGYSPKSAAAQGAKLLKEGKVAAEIASRRAKMLKKLEISAESVLAEMARCGFSNMQDYLRLNDDGAPVVDFSDLTRDQFAPLQEVTVEEFVDGRSDKRKVRRTKFKLAEKHKALFALGQHFGLFTEKHEHTHQLTAVRSLLDAISEGAASRPLIDITPETEK